jgi:hypothetical protein
VNLLNNFVGALPVHKTKRYDKRKKKYVEIPCPNAVVAYNKFMGGVSLVDSVMALYHTTVRSKKYYRRIFFSI